jgi:hypothetical protein
MHNMLTRTVTLALFGAVLTLAGGASAAPLPAGQGWSQGGQLEQIGWRRYAWRHPVVVAPTVVNPYVAPVAPPPPACGPYAYWNGYGCVAASYYSPYVSPYATPYVAPWFY